MGDRQRRVGARVVGDDDAPGEGEPRVEVAVQALDGSGERALLVVDRHDEVDLEVASRAPGQRRDRRHAEGPRRRRSRSSRADRGAAQGMG
nr:hypothetical protein [Capillimicrobium parvum]